MENRNCEIARVKVHISLRSSKMIPVADSSQREWSGADIGGERFVKRTFLSIKRTRFWSNLVGALTFLKGRKEFGEGRFPEGSSPH